MADNRITWTEKQVLWFTLDTQKDSIMTEGKITIMKKLIPALLVFGLAFALALNPLTALAWDASTEGNSETENSSDVQGQPSGETSVEGWIGTFDGGEDPNRPDPPAESWINVKIPTTALFGSLATDNGGLYSPMYHIYNYSTRSVDITPSEFNVVSEPTELSGMTLNLNFTQPTTLVIPLRNSGDQFLGNGISNSSAINLGSGTTDAPTTATFTMSGQLPNGFTYPSDSPYRPSYGLVFTFEADTAAAA